MKRIRGKLISWAESYALAKKLARKIKCSHYRPDMVIAIGRGGYIPARIVCDFLSIEELTSIRVAHWHSIEKKERAKLVFPLRVNIKNKKVLIVDDLTDTGETLVEALRHVKKKMPKEVKTAVLQHKIISSFVPDYFAHEIVKWVWIIYPWAVYEDVGRFAEMIISENELKMEDISNILKKNFGIRISNELLLWVLNELRVDGKMYSKIRNGNEYWYLK